MDDIAIVWITGPRHICLSICKRHADGVHAGYEFAVFAQGIQDLLTDAGHDMHISDDVWRIGHLHTNVSNGRADRPHAKRDHIHCAALHAT